MNKCFNLRQAQPEATIASGSSSLMAGTIIAIAPLFVLFLIFQRRFIESFATSGMK